MRTNPLRLLLLLAALAMLTLAGHARAQAIQVNATISPAEISLGDSGILEIAISGAENAASKPPPPAPLVPGLQIEFAGVTNSAAPVVIVNGQRRDMGPDKVVFQYRVTPTSSGRFTIPAIPVTIGARTISTAPLTVTAAEPPEARDIKLTLKLDATEAYVGQPVTAHLMLDFATDLQSVRFSTNTKSTKFEVFDAPNPDEQNADRVIGIDLDGRKVRGALGRTRNGAQEWRRLSMAYTIIPDQAGSIEIPAPVAVVEIMTGEEGYGLFRQSVTERRVARAQPITLNVKPLPAEGRPADFSGLVGRFSLDADASPTTVHVGEPITIKLSVSGSEPLERAAAPALDGIPAFASSFKLSPEGWAEADAPANATHRSRIFTTTVRATSDTLSEIPAISLSYFDPAKAAYQSASTRPIPLDVQKTRQITAADAIGSGTVAMGARLPKVERVAVESASSGAVFAPIPTHLSSQHLLLTEQLRAPLVAGAIALPPVAFAAAAILAVRRRTADPERARRRGALHAALRKLGSSPTPESAGEAMRIFLADRFGMARATITAHDAHRLITPFSPELAEQAARALLGADATRFADAAPTRPFPASEVRALLQKLDEVISQ